MISSYLDVLKTIWENRDSLVYAFRILRDGVCDGCSLGTKGLRDWTISGLHLCWIRLNLLRLNTMPPFSPEILSDVTPLRNLDERRLRRLGRIPKPMIRRRGDKGFKVIGWGDAIDEIASWIKSTTPNRIAFYLTSRGTLNETYYVAQKVARFLGTNNIDNSARVCHAPSTTALKQTIGYAASTCSYKDVIGTDLLVIFGSNVANNQPVFMKYIEEAKRRGTRVVVVNPFLEPGLRKYRVPSSVRSVVFGTRVADYFYKVRVGGDIAFINGVLKYLVENGWVDHDFINKRTRGWPELVRALERQRIEDLERFSGIPRERMLEFARIYGGARTAVFVWSMGITMHSHGVKNVKAIVNLALARGMVGRPKTGLMAIRGHSGVQGGAEMGAVPDKLPGGVPLDREGLDRFKRLWGFEVPAARGYYITEVVEAAWRGEIDVLYCIGGNLPAVLPDTRFVEEAVKRVPFRVYHDIVLNPQMLIDPGDTVLILPATTRYEVRGGGTETTTERRVVYSPEIPGRRVPDAREEWRVLVDVAKRVKPGLSHLIDFKDTQEIREEIAAAVPVYNGIQRLRRKGDSFQWGGERLCSDGFGTPDGRAVFTPLYPPQVSVPEGYFQLISRRGKQFNSMVLGGRDPLTNTRRNEVVMSGVDMKRLGLSNGDEVVIRSDVGSMRAFVVEGEVSEGVVVAYWPECNVLIRRGSVDPECGIPAYRGQLVRVEKAHAP